MIKLIFITDFTESFAYSLLRGIIKYSKQTKQWVVCRMPPAYMRRIGLKGVVKFARNWGAHVVIGQFEPGDDVSLFRQNGIIAFAQDYKKMFTDIPNITADYNNTGRMAAEVFLSKGFRNFGFFGYRDVCWSDERCRGFRERIEEAGFKNNLYSYSLQDINSLWSYDEKKLGSWLKSLPKPIAVFSCDDNQGSILINACNTAGISIPDELSLLGVDNDEVICNLSNPTLSSIVVDIEQGGYETAQSAEKMLESGTYTCPDIVLHPRKVVTRLSSSVYATTDKEILSALQFIQMNISSKISVGDILKEVPLSRRLLEIRFKQITHESIYQYISRLRVEYFCDRLIETTDSILSIAYEMGETDSKAISRRFKALKGCTPSEWRAKNFAN